MIEIANWHDLCLLLDVNDAKMEALRHSSNIRNEEKKQECLQTYFDTGEAYWEEVVLALIKYPISNSRVANKIIKEHNLASVLFDGFRTFHCVSET